MRGTIDCGVLMVPQHAEWMQQWMARNAAAMGRVQLHAVALQEGGGVIAAGAREPAPDGTVRVHAYNGTQAAAHALARLAVALRRFDACLLPVTPDTLGWTRTALSCAQGTLRTPLVGVARGLKAAAVEDLLALGMCDFVRDPLCREELRVRLERVGVARRAAAAQGGGSGTGLEPADLHAMSDPPSYAAATSSDRLPGDAGVWTQYGHADGGARELADPLPLNAVAPGSAAHYAVHEPALHYDMGPMLADHSCGATAGAAGRRRLAPQAIENALLSIQAAPRIHPDEPFRLAKSRVVDSFERDYVRTALSRHAGNVARAARASSKHRRAFWALMRKHQIDAAPYRPRQERPMQVRLGASVPNA